MVEQKYQKPIAATLVVLGVIQAGSFIGQDDLIFALAGVAYALAGVAFWFEI